MSAAVARSKEIGADVEDLVDDQLEAIELVLDEHSHHDAVVAGLLCPSLVNATVPVIWAGTPLVESGTQVEIKGCTLWTDGETPRRGRWLLKGRDDGQHASLLDNGAVYVLAVYDGTGASRSLVAIAIIPAALLDEHLRGRWWSTDRSEGTFARLGWPHVFDADLTGGEDGG